MSLLDWNAIPHDLCNFKMHLRVGGDQSRLFELKFSLHSQSFRRFIHLFIFCCLLAAVARSRGDSRLTRTAKLENLPNADVHAFFKFFSHVCFFSIKAASHAMTVCTFIGCFLFLHQWFLSSSRQCSALCWPTLQFATVQLHFTCDLYVTFFQCRSVLEKAFHCPETDRELDSERRRKKIGVRSQTAFHLFVRYYWSRFKSRCRWRTVLSHQSRRHGYFPLAGAQVIKDFRWVQPKFCWSTSDLTKTPAHKHIMSETFICFQQGFFFFVITKAYTTLCIFFFNICICVYIYIYLSYL